MRPYIPVHVSSCTHNNNPRPDPSHINITTIPQHTHTNTPPQRRHDYWNKGIWMVVALHVASLATAGGHSMRARGALVLGSLDQQV